jgi:hypothetical protein
MADCFPGEIKIGGSVPTALVDEFLRQVSCAGGSVGGYDGPAFDCRDAEGLREALNESGHLVLADPEARYGQFEELEQWCVRHGVAFDRHSDAKWEYDAENVRFRPGMKHPVVVPSDNCGSDLVDADRIRPVAQKLARLAVGRVSKDRLLAALRKACRKLDRLLPPQVAPLPPLEIVEERG